MFEETMIVSALMLNRKISDDVADRRAFYGPDVQGVEEKPRRAIRVPHFLRRGTNAV